MRHLHRHRRAIDQHNLVAPVELVGLPRRKAQRDEGGCIRNTARLFMELGITPYAVVAAAIAETAKLLVYPHQRQTLACRFAGILRQQPIQIGTPPVDRRARLMTTLVFELGRVRAQNLAHHLPRQTKIPADQADRPLLNKMSPTDLRNRLHYQHPSIGS